MPKIICTIPNATSPINGYEFELHPDGGLVSVDDLSGEDIDALLTIDGFRADGVTAELDESADELAALRARAEELGIAVKGNWREARLKAEIERAEAA